MLEILRQELSHKSIAIENIGERIKDICQANGQKLKEVSADLGECELAIQTDTEKFQLPYHSFNPVNQTITFN